MKHYLTDLRKEAGLYLIRAHPEVRLRDIGLALGLGHGTALSTTSDWSREAGISRPPGKGAESFPKTSGIRPFLLMPHKSEVKRLLLANKDFAHIAAKYDVDPTSVGHFARNVLNIHIGKGRRHYPKRIADKEFAAYLAEHPKDTVAQLAAALGYRPTGYFRRRVQDARAGEAGK